MARRQLTLNPGQQLVDFVDGADLFGDFLASHSGEFKGTLNINASGQGKLAAIGLLQKRATGALIAISTSPNAFRRALGRRKGRPHAPRPNHPGQHSSRRRI